jgi:TRAP transporter TAXI family solute receptor
MRMRWLFIPIVLIVSFAFGGWFAWSWYEETHAERTLILGAGPRDSEDYAFAQTFARVLPRWAPRFKVRVIETLGGLENTTLLADGTFDLALVSADVPLSPELRVVDFLFPELYHLVVRRGSGISQVKDLAGQAIGLPPEGSSARPLFAHLVRHYGLSPDTIKPVSLLPREATAALQRGTVAAYFRLIALGSPSMRQMLETAPVELVAIDQAQALGLSLPALRPATIPKGAYNGGGPIPPEDLPVVALQTLLVTRAEQSARDIFDIVRILHEARSDFVHDDNRAALIPPDESPLNQGLPLHAGTLDYFLRDEPPFVVRYAETMGFLLSAGVFVLSGLWHIKRQAEARSKNRADVYNSNLIRLAERAQQATQLTELDGIRRELFAIFPQLFEDLDRDRISQTSLQGINLACTVVTQVLQARQAALANHREA